MYVAQGKAQIDAKIAEKGRFRTGTSLRQGVAPYSSPVEPEEPPSSFGVEVDEPNVDHISKTVGFAPRASRRTKRYTDLVRAPTLAREAFEIAEVNLDLERGVIQADVEERGLHTQQGSSTNGPLGGTEMKLFAQD